MTRLILASGSSTRRAMLATAGVKFEATSPDIDEDAIKIRLRDKGASAEAVAIGLAIEKAKAVSLGDISALVIGADQMLECEGIWFNKPRDRDEAGEHLRFLRNRTHRLHTATVLASNGQSVWESLETARLEMRDFSDGFIKDYLGQAGAAVLGSVGGYQIEGLGIQLFSAIEGDFFGILGLPLLPLLAELRKRGEFAR